MITGFVALSMWAGMLVGGCDVYEVVGFVLVGHGRGCITKMVEVNEWFGDREEKWGVVTGMLAAGAVGWGGVSPILGMLW